MSLRALLKTELHWGRRHLLVLVFLLLVVPLAVGGASLVFQDVVPEHIPVAVVEGDEEVSDTELELVMRSVDPWTDAKIVDSRTEAERLLERESVYGIVVVPPDYLQPETNATFTLVTDGSIAPFQSPSELIQDLIAFELQAAGFSENLTVEQEVSGEERGFEEYLYPGFMMGLLLFIAFTYVPYSLRREEPVLDRLRVEASLESVVVTKLAFLTALMALPLLVFHAVSWYYNYGVNTGDPWGIAVLLLTFLLAATVSLTIVILTRFSRTGQLLNLVVLFGTLILSGLVFPRGFFSPLRSTIVELVPTYYAGVIVRSRMLKDSEILLFTDWLLGLVLLQLLAFVALFAAITYYRRSE